MKKYNGWKNRATWLTNLNLTNSEALYEALVSCRSPSEVLRLTVEQAPTMPDYPEIEQNLADVDWKEIYKSAGIGDKISRQIHRAFSKNVPRKKVK